ncbi:MAG: hypothetical protein U0271_04040 [Polyangiaceae bacterium]
MTAIDDLPKHALDERDPRAERDRSLHGCGRITSNGGGRIITGGGTIGVGGGVGICAGDFRGGGTLLEALGVADGGGTSLGVAEAVAETLPRLAALVLGALTFGAAEVAAGVTLADPVVAGASPLQPPATELASATTRCARMRSRRSGSNGMGR